MKIFITGGAGFIGSWLVDKLIKENHQVIVIDNLSTGKKEHIHKKAIFYEQDITDHEILNDIIKKEAPEIIFHLAANSLLRKSIDDPLYDATTNILGTISVLEACRKNNIKKIMYTSTGGARVGEPAYLPVDESHPIKPLSPYGISKHSAEHYVEMYHALYGIDYFIFCFGNVYGPRDSPYTKRLVPVFIDKIMKNEKPIIFGDGKQTRDFIYVKDLIDFMIETIPKLGITPHKLFHLANGKQVSVNEVCEMLKKISNTSLVFEHTDTVKGEIHDIVLNISLAKKELQWDPKIPIEEGLTQTWNWYKEQYKK